MMIDDNDDKCFCRGKCQKLPLHESSAAEQPSVDFVIMMVDLSNKER